MNDLAPLPLEADLRAELRSPEPTIRFMLAGDAHVTFQSRKTDTRFTFRVVAADKRDGSSRVSHFVHLLTGSDQYAYLGCIYEGRAWRHGTRSKVSHTATSVVAFTWCWAQLTGGKMPATLAVYHEGRCGRCGRRLTTPESIETGLGPVCATKGDDQ